MAEHTWTESERTSPRAHRAGLVAGVLVAVFLSCAAVVWWSGLDRGRGQFDQINFHLPVIRKFAAEWPRVDVRDYQSATTPGYHLALAALARAGADSTMVLRIAGSIFTIGMLGLLGGMIARRGAAAGHGAAVLVLLGLVTASSMYVFAPGAWLQPDNAGWLGVLAMIALTWPLVDGAKLSTSRLIACAVVLTSLVCVRQSHAWAGGLVVLGAWLGAITQRADLRTKAARGALAALACVPAALVLGWLVMMWGGLTPPSFRTQHAGGNPATPAFALSLLAVYSVFMSGWMISGDMRRLREHKWWILVGAFIGLACALVPATTYLYESRASGLWNIVKAMDARGLVRFERTSPLIVVLSTLGGACAAVWIMSLGRLRAMYALGLLCGFVLAQSANANAWQRYLEPLLLMGITLIAAGQGANTGAGRRARVLGIWRIAGPGALALVLAGLTVQSITRTERFESPTNKKTILLGAAGVGGVSQSGKVNASVLGTGVGRADKDTP